MEQVLGALNAITERLNTIESRFDNNQVNNPATGGDNSHVTDDVAPEALPEQGALQAVDLQGEFHAIKDSVQSVRLPADLHLNDSRSGIKRSDQPLATVVRKSARYVETSLKLLTELNNRAIRQDDVQKLFEVQVAHIRYLQEEQAAILVGSQFSEDTAKLFRAVQQNTSVLTPEALKILTSIAPIATAARANPTSAPRGQSSFRGGYRGGFRGRNQPFQNFSRFPPRRPNEAAGADPGQES